MVGATAGPPATLGAPVSYDDTGAGGAVACAVGACLRFAAPGFLCGALTLMVGSIVLPAVGGGVLAGGVSPGAAGVAVCATARRQSSASVAAMPARTRCGLASLKARRGNIAVCTPVACHRETKSTRTSGKSGRLVRLPAGTPRPTCSRVTAADGRSPGSRVPTLRRLPGRISQWTCDERFAAHSCGGSRSIERTIARTAFPFDPQRGEPSGLR